MQGKENKYICVYKIVLTIYAADIKKKTAYGSIIQTLKQSRLIPLLNATFCT